MDLNYKLKLYTSRHAKMYRRRYLLLLFSSFSFIILFFLFISTMPMVERFLLAGIELLVFSIFLTVIFLKFYKDLFDDREKFRTILANIIDGIIEYDIGDRINFINPTAEELLNVRKEKIVGEKINKCFLENLGNKLLLDIFYPTDVDGAKSKEIILLHTKERIVKALELELSEPREIHWQVITIPILDKKDRVVSYVKVIRDIAKEKESLKLKSEFVSLTAHQMQTPLTNIKWIFKTIIDGDAGPVTNEQKSLIEKGYETVGIMVELVSDLLNVSKIESGRFGYQFSYHNILSILDKAVESVKIKVKSKNINLVYLRPLSNLPQIKFDEIRVRMVIDNFLDNAIKYTSPGGKIEVAVKEEKPYLKISVKDTGVGIPKEQLSKLFAKFFRATNVQNLDIKGTGLGLYISKNIIERHGGSIWVESEEGIGSTFYFTLPEDEKLIPEEKGVFE